MSPRLIRIMVFFAPILFGCAANNDETPSREEARALGGKQDHIDLCDALHWYGDGICDDFCPQWDEDCGPEPARECYRNLLHAQACPEGQYCDYGSMCGANNEAGTCHPRPDACPEIVGTPVCGCDGNTYSSACQASVAGVSVAQEGECEQPECVVAGCSRELCIEEGEPVSRNCEWQAEYACYPRHGQCERQPSGECGWTPTDELSQCLMDPPIDCRSTGCREGSSCSFCWTGFACVPDGAVC